MGAGLRPHLGPPAARVTLNVHLSWVGTGADLSSQDGVRGSMSSSTSILWQRDGEGGGMGSRPWGSSDVERQVEAQSPLLFRALLCHLSLGNSEVGRAEQGGPPHPVC